MTSQTQDLVITNTSSIPPSNTISFGYVKKEDVKVELGTTEQNRQLKSYPSEWTITSDNKVQLISSLFSATGTYKLRISRQTDTSTPAHTFVVGSSIKAEDLNNTNKQALFAVEENTDSINSLAMGDASGAIQIDGSNIADNSINSDKIINLQVKDVDLSSHISDDSLRAVTTNHIRDNAVTTAKIPDDNVTANKLKSSSSTDSDRAVTTNHIRDGAVTDAKLSNISGTSINPNFGSQNISTTGTLNAGTTTTGTTTTGSTTAQDLTVTGNATFNNGISTNGKDVFTNNGAFITSDSQGHFSNRSGDNIDHIWHDDSDNSWNFVSDDPYKATGNSKIRAGSFYGDGSTLSGLNFGNVRQIQEAASTGESSTNSSAYSDKVTLSVGTASNTRVMIFFGFEMKHSSSNNARVWAKVTGSNDSPVSGDQEFSQTGNAYNQYSGQMFDIGSHSGTRTYRIQWKRTSNTGYIRNAYLVAIAFNL